MSTDLPPLPKPQDMTPPHSRNFVGFVKAYDEADMRDYALAAIAADRAARAEPGWQPIETAPKDGTLVLLLIEDGEHPLSDESPSMSIGSFGVEGGPEEDPTWHFAGWSWHQDCYCRGTGTPVGWMPLPAAPEPKP